MSLAGEGSVTIKHREVKHSDIKLVLNKVRTSRVINAMEFKMGKITSIRGHQEWLPKPRGCVMGMRSQDIP